MVACTTGEIESLCWGIATRTCVAVLGDRKLALGDCSRTFVHV